jgi:3-methylcrotonyl-CoA carboxylase alpha subunit
MNTRLQVEHPVTEMITGLDLVEWQLRVAAGEPLPKSQPMLAMHGHAIEARIYAEDPQRGFLPSIGHITHWRMPEASARVRVDTGFRAGDEVTPYYDPMLAKVIAWGEDRERARDGLLRALSRCEVTGVATNIALLERVVAHEAFASGNVDTGLIEAHREALLAPATSVPPDALIAAAVAEHRDVEAAARARAAMSADRWSPWNLTDAWWNGSTMHHLAVGFDDGEHRHALTVKPLPGGWLDVHGDGVHREMQAEPFDGGLRFHERGVRRDAYAVTVVRDGDARHVFGPGMRVRLVHVDPLAHTDDEVEQGGHLTAPMSGTIVAVMVGVGDAVDKGNALIVLEAMKMEHTIVAPAAGRVAAIHFAVGDRVGEGADLVDIDDTVESSA